MKKLLISVLVLIIFFLPSFSRIKKTKTKINNIFNFSFSPYVYFEPIEGSNTLYLNLIPFTSELSYSDKNGIRFTTIAGLKLYSYGLRFGQIGCLFSLPVYQNPRTVNGSYNGYFTAPLAKIVYNPSESYTAVTIANENGFMFYFKQNLSLSLSIQAGYTYFFFPDPTLNKGIVFSGFSLSSGLWLF